MVGCGIAQQNRTALGTQQSAGNSLGLLANLTLGRCLYTFFRRHSSSNIAQSLHSQ